MPTRVHTRAAINESAADVLVEALVFSDPHTDPFRQAATVAEYLWDHGLILVKSSHPVCKTITTAVLWGLTGALTLLVSEIATHTQ